MAYTGKVTVNQENIELAWYCLKRKNYILTKASRLFEKKTHIQGVIPFVDECNMYPELLLQNIDKNKEVIEDSFINHHVSLNLRSAAIDLIIEDELVIINGEKIHMAEILYVCFSSAYHYWEVIAPFKGTYRIDFNQEQDPEIKEAYDCVYQKLSLLKDPDFFDLNLQPKIKAMLTKCVMREYVDYVDCVEMRYYNNRAVIVFRSNYIQVGEGTQKLRSWFIICYDKIKRIFWGDSQEIRQENFSPDIFQFLKFSKRNIAIEYENINGELETICFITKEAKELYQTITEMIADYHRRQQLKKAIKESKNETTQKAVICKKCGAVNQLEAGNSGICEYCGAPIEVSNEPVKVLVELPKSEKVNSAMNRDPYEELKKLKELLDMGIVTEEEFTIKKKQLLKL